MANWHFRIHDGYADINQSSSAEAFEGSAAKNLATSIVRESIQNVLDVVLDESQPVRVRFTLVEPAPSNSSHSHWFNGLMHHLQQPGVGVPDPPHPDEPCRYLLIEDFNTTGLVGDYNAPYAPDTENNFVNFLYHDGLTGKVEKKLGSRGVGKIVLLLASRARTIFAYTIRATVLARHDAEVKRIVMGFVRAFEEARRAVVHNVHTPELARAAGLTDNFEFDLLSVFPTGDPRGRRAIEVKGRTSPGDIEVSFNEWARADNPRDGYWLYAIYNCTAPAPELARVKDPFGQLLARAKGSILISA